MVRVIVLNWNGRSWLEPCLRALASQTLRDVEVVLVDNGSTDGSVELVRDRFPGCEVRALGENRGFAGGNNAGARGAVVPYLVFLNNDTIADPEWLQLLVAEAERWPDVGLVTSQLVFMSQPDLVDSAGDGYLRCGAAFKHGHGARVAARSGSVEVFGACGGAFLIRRALFEQLGGFDEDLFMVYEDVDLSYRARLVGARCVCAHGAIVRHAGSASLGRLSASAVFYGQRNLEWVYLKNTPARLLWRSLPSHLLFDAAGLAGYATAGLGSAWLKGKLAAIRGLPGVLRKRRIVQRAATVSADELWKLMRPDWIAIKRREKRFAFQPALGADPTKASM